ncbi:MAG: RadC family protein [Candidatus Woesearchaeota archaeon]
MRIKDIIEEYRPREKLLREGVMSLSDTELLSIIINNGTRRENAVQIADKLISKYGLNRLSNLSVKELKDVEGIGSAKACQIIALLEFNKRYAVRKNKSRRISCSRDVYEHCSPRMSEHDKEYFIALLLDTKNKIIREETISIGTLNSSLVHPREVFKNAIKESANSIILVHNHPSGDPEPSEEDIEITRILMRAGELLNIKVLDHVIIGKEGYYSFSDSMRMD